MSNLALKRMKEKKQAIHEFHIEKRRVNSIRNVNKIEDGDIENLVFTSNDYMHLVRIYAHLYNEFWDSERKVKVLGYDEPNFELPNNFEFVSLGKQTGGPQNWSNPLREYIQSLTCKYIVWSTEDLFIIENVHLDMYAHLVTMIKGDDSIGRIGLTKDIEITEKYDIVQKLERYDIIMKGQDEPFRIGGIWSLWNKDYLLKYLKPDMTPWSFENQEEAINDGYKILGTRRNYVLSFCGSINSGPKKSDKDRLDFLKQPLDFDSFNESGKRLGKRYTLKLKELGFMDENSVAIRPR